MNEHEIFLGAGCFWGVQEFFRIIKEKKFKDWDLVVGYANSVIPNPSYDLVCSGITNAVEVVSISSYKRLDIDFILTAFIKIININDVLEHFSQYRNGIYYANEFTEYAIKNFVIGRGIAVEVKVIDNFFPAETYHQNYIQKHPLAHCHIDLSLAYELCK